MSEKSAEQLRNTVELWSEGFGDNRQEFIDDLDAMIRQVRVETLEDLTRFMCKRCGLGHSPEYGETVAGKEFYHVMHDTRGRGRELRPICDAAKIHQLLADKDAEA